MEQKIVLYYDSYEKDFGDGFYPVTEKNNTCSKEIIITFLLKDQYWIQTNESIIFGLDGDEGKILLDKLNIGTEKGIGIKNNLLKKLYPKII
jgi:hypothetical protein